MWILRDLLNEDVVRHDVLYEWLGRRYAETSDFLASRKYFKMARDIRQGIAVDVTKVHAFSGPYSHAAIDPLDNVVSCACTQVVPTTRDKVLTAHPDAIFGLAEYGEEPPISEYDRRWRGAGGGATGFDLGMQRHDFAVERYKKTAGVDMATNEFRKYPLKAHTWHAAADEVSVGWTCRTRSLPPFSHASRPTPPPRSLRPGGGHPPRRGAAGLLHAAEGAPGRRHRALRRAHAGLVRAPGRLKATRDEVFL